MINSANEGTALDELKSGILLHSDMKYRRVKNNLRNLRYSYTVTLTDK